MKLFELLAVFFFVLYPFLALAQDDYSFDMSEIEKEIEKKPYSIGGFLEFQPILFWLDQDAAFYKLRFFDRSKRETLDQYGFTLLLDAAYEKGIAGFFLRTVANVKESDFESSSNIDIFEGYGSVKPSPLFKVDVGKKTLYWGTGYAWNPVGFVQRPRDPDDPNLPLEGLIMATADYTRSFKGPLETVSLTPVVIPVYENINESFGEINNINFAGKVYFLFYDTDIDFMLLTGDSKPSRFGFDFSRNITSNLEIHGEFAFINNFKQKFIDSDGRLSERTFDATSYLVGVRYLTAYDTTFISEYYHNGTGFTTDEMQDFLSFVGKGHDLFLTSGDGSLLGKASSLAEGSYGRRNPMRDYFYLRISQKEPFDILYFTPGITWIYNIDDGSYALTPELLYTGITNLEVRLRGGLIVGGRGAEYGEKQNNYRVELRVRYYFDAVKLFNQIRR